MKGRPSTSNELKRQRGTLRKDREKHALPVREIVSLPDPPEEIINEFGKKIWREVGLQIANISLLTEADIFLFTQYCIYSGIFYENAKVVKEKGAKEGYYDFYGAYQQRTREEFKIMNKARDKISEIETKIGLDPMARERLKAVIGAKISQEKDKFLA